MQPSANIARFSAFSRARRRLLCATLLCGSALTLGCSGTQYTSTAPARADVAAVKAEIDSTQPVAQTLHVSIAADKAREVFVALSADAGMLCRTLAEAPSCDTPDFEVIDSNVPNAFASYRPDQQPQIAVTRALVELFADQPDQLAYIIAHQYGHLISGQITRVQQSDGLAEELLTSAMSVLSAAGTTSSSRGGPYGSVRRTPAYSQAEIDAYLNSDIHSSAFDSFSRAEEREADYLATYLAARNGFTPNGGALIELGALQQRDPRSLYDKLDEQAPFAWWDTHSYSADRIVRVRETLIEMDWLKSKGYQRPIPPRLINTLTEDNDSIHSLEDLVYP